MRHWASRMNVFTNQTSKRVPKAAAIREAASEQLECRALLSATMSNVDDLISPAMVSTTATKVNVPQNVAGTWTISGTGAGILKSVGKTSGEATFTQQNPVVTMAFDVIGLQVTSTITLPITGTKATAEIDIPGFDTISATGKATKNKLDFSGKLPIDGKKTTVALSIKFASGANPTSFTGTLKFGGKTVMNLQGTKL